MSATELMNSTPAKIVLSVQRDDSINRISEKIRVSYSWVYDWVERLERENIIVNTDNGIQIVDYEMCREYNDILAALYRRGTVSQEDAYVIPHFAGMEFAYTEIDAAYVWTEGGYQIARNHNDYPVFLKVHSRDLERWIGFFDQYGIEATAGERIDAEEVEGDLGVYYVLFPADNGIDTEWVNGNPVVPLQDTIDMMMENRPAYEPALEIIAEEYDVDMDIDPTHHGRIAETQT